jgi:hypothetical protein
MRWSTVARFGWQAMQPPDPKSLVSRAQRAWGVAKDIGDGCELWSEVLKLSENEGDQESCSKS